MDLSVPEGRLFHVGYVAADLQHALGVLSQVFPLEWTEPAQMTTRVRDARTGVTVDVDLEVAYTRTGPPHLEVVSARQHSLWWTTAPLRLHHLGAWANGDVALSAARLEAAGCGMVAHGLDADGAPARVSYHESPWGHLIELVDPTSRGPWSPSSVERPCSASDAVEPTATPLRSVHCLVRSGEWPERWREP